MTTPTKPVPPRKERSPLLLAGGILMTVVLLLLGLKSLPVFDAPQPANVYALPDEVPVPSWVSSAGRQVREAYAFAANNHELLQYIPCYCGCDQLHTDNSTCYFVRDEDGRITAYESHAIA